MVRFGTDSCANEGKESKQPFPPPALPLPLKRILSPSDICPKQFWDFSRKFPELFRNISNIFRYFVRPLFIGFCDPPKLFRYFSNIFRYFPNVFWNISNIFRYISGIFRDTFGPVPVTCSDHCVQFLELSVLQSHNLSSFSWEPSINVLWNHPKTSDCGMASQTPIKSEDAISDTFNINVAPEFVFDKFVRTFLTESNEIWRRWAAPTMFFSHSAFWHLCIFISSQQALN